MSKNRIIRSSIIIIIFTIITKVMGFFREAFVASKFGATYDTDIYTFAMGLIFLIFASIGGGIGTTFIPLLNEYIEKKDFKERNSFVNNILNITGLFSIILTIVSYIYAAHLVYIFAPGFRGNQEVFIKMVSVTRIIEISMIFIGYQSIMSAVLQCHSRFGIPAAMSVFSNLIILIYLAFFTKYYGIWGLSIVTVAGYALQLAIHIPVYRSLGYRYNLKINLKDVGFRIMLKLMFPIIIGTSFAQVSLLVDRLLATTTGEGSLAVLNFAYKLNTFIYGIFAVAISTVVYPSLSKHSARDDREGYIKSLITAVNMIILIMIPATVGMDLLRNPIITLLFKRGQFTENAAQLTASVFLFYSPSMIVFGVRDVLNMAFYSSKNTRTPMLNGLAGVIVNIVINLILVKQMGVSGLALATSIAAITTTILLMLNLGKKLGHGFLIKIWRGIYKVSMASIIMGVFVFMINKYCIGVYGDGALGSMISIFMSAVSGAIIYCISIYLLKVEELNEIGKIISLKLKLKRKIKSLEY